VARAKRTERAEARRRYRAAAAADPENELAEESAPSAGATRSASGSASKSSAATPVRTGFSQAFRQSFRPMNVREDLASLPWLAIHTKALWLPLLITVGATVYVFATGGKDTISEFMFAYFIQTPAIGSVFLAGFLAPRSSWLLGAIVGFVSAICYAVLVVGFPTMIPGASGLPPTEAQAREVALSALILSPIIGSFFAAAAAWYRRFLALSSPNRGRKASQAPKQKPGDGRTRAGTTQKAGVKR
jgi:hypothetical protein